MTHGVNCILKGFGAGKTRSVVTKAVVILEGDVMLKVGGNVVRAFLHSVANENDNLWLL